MDKISVIIPAIENMDFFSNCLSSIFNSTYRNLEVIIIDNGYHDEVVEASEEFKKDIIHVSSGLLNKAEAYNLGFTKAQGHYLSFIDAQDINGKMRYELSVKRFQDEPKTGMVFCATTFIDECGTFMTGVSKFPSFSSNYFLGKMFESNNINTISSTLILSSIFKKSSGFDESFNHAYDYDLFLRVGSKTRVEYIDLPLVRNRITPERISLDWNDYRNFETKAIQKHDPVVIAEYLSRAYNNEEEFRISLGKLLYRIGKTNDALLHLNKAQKLNCENDDAYFHAGNCYYKIRKYKLAHDEYSKCLNLNPEHAGCRNNAGVLYFHMGEYEKSVSELKKALKYGDNFLEPKYNLKCIKDDRSRGKLRLSLFGKAQLPKDRELH